MGTSKTYRLSELGVLMLTCFIAHINGAATSTEGQQNRSMYYVCPPDFVRLGNSCYYFSPTMATWQDAHFACKDRESNLTSPHRWEDRNLRNYLNKPEVEKRERWIGGVYDWEAKAWKWGGEMKTMNYQSFSRLRHFPEEDLKWNCVAMVPELHYRWAPKSCVEGKYYICQTRLRKVKKSERNKLRERWNPNGTGNMPNEVSIPDTTDYENHNNNVNPNPSTNVNRKTKLRKIKKKPNRHDNEVSPEPLLQGNASTINNSVQNTEQIGSAAYAHRQDGKKNAEGKKKKKKPFKGYISNKDDPEAAYIHNVNALKSGKSGLSPVQIDKHLRRLERLRKKDERAKLRKERIHDQQNRERNSQTNNDLPDNVLAAKVNIIRSRNLIDGTRDFKQSKRKNKGKGFSYTFENVTQKTYIMNNQLSALHPKTIVEVHEFAE